VQLRFDDKGTLNALNGETSLGEASYRPNAWHRLEIVVDATSGKYDLTLDGHSVVRQAGFAEPAATLERIEFRTGSYRNQPTRDLDRAAGEDLPNAGDPVPAAVFYLDDVTIR
jgi:hypothetical protein